MKTTGDFISSATKLSACMKHRKDNLQSRFTGLFLGVYGNAASIVTDADNVSRFNGDFYMGTVSRQSLINRVIYNFVDKMMQTGG